MSNAVIITSYIEDFSGIKDVLNSEDYVICADGGWDIATELGILLDLLIGDFDSIKSPLPDGIETIKFLPEKDYTDLDLAIRTAVEKGYSHLTVIGGIGGRLDHTIANIQLLSHYDSFFDSLIMMDGRNVCFIIDSKKKDRFVIRRENDSYLSFFSLSEKCTGVSINGVKYPLCDHTLTRTFPLGVSNEFTEKNAVLSIKDGTLLAVISRI